MVECTGQVGGLARSARVAGNEVDLGGHRLLSGVEDQRRLWSDFADRLGGIDLCDLGRRSGILRDGFVVTYPVDWRQFRYSAPWQVRARAAGSLVMQKLRSSGDRKDGSLDDWVKNRYGPYLTGMFIDPHVRKVFGIDPGKIPGTWAAQRIASPRVGSILASALPRRRGPTEAVDEIDRFFYPVGGVGVLWTRLAEVIGNQAHWFFNSHVESIAKPVDGRFSVVVSGPSGNIAVSCGRIISTGRPEDLATSIGLEDLGATISKLASRRKLVIGVVRVDKLPTAWEGGYQWLYTHDVGVRANRFHNYGEWRGLGCPKGIIGLEYTVSADDVFDVRANVLNDMPILAGKEPFEFLGSEVSVDAYSNFDASSDELDLFDSALQQFGEGLISTGRQGAGAYINLHQALRLGTRAADMRSTFSGVLGRSEYSSYQERVRQKRASDAAVLAAQRSGDVTGDRPAS